MKLTDKITDDLDRLSFHTKKMIWKQLTSEFFGVSHMKHLTISNNFWTFITWNQDEVPHIKNDSKLNDNIDKLIQEMQNTDRKTTVKPDQIQLISGAPKQHKIISYQQNKENILTNIGMAEMAKRAIGTSATSNTHHAVGVGATAETLNDLTLETEAGRKLVGAKSVVNQTERYGSAFTYANVGSVNQNITEAGIYTGPNSNPNSVLMLRVTSDPQTITVDRVLTVQTNVSHQNGVQI